MRLKENGVNVAFQVIHCYEWLIERKSKHFSVREPDKKRADQSRPLRDANRIDVLEPHLRLLNRFAHNRRDLPQVFARGQLRHDPAVFAVNINLRRNDAGQDFYAVGDNRRRRFIARRFDSENPSRQTTVPFRTVLPFAMLAHRTSLLMITPH